MGARALTAVVGTAAALWLGLAPPAPGAWSPARLVSASAGEQALTATVRAVLSADGRFVVFQTTARNLMDIDSPDGTYRRGGLLRAELATGDLDLVAAGELRDAETDEVLQGGAGVPSVSADGRYVAFVTPEALVPADGNAQPDVYVRDMDGPPTAVELASSLDGPARAPAYAPGTAGAFPPPGAALSADGRSVLFVTAASSDLPAGAAEVAAGQVLVRHLRESRTVLVTEGRDPSDDRRTGEPVGGVAVADAALSADGGTVVWAGRNAPAQTAYVAGEANSDEPQLRELLWRRIAAGPQAPTLRVAGLGDPQDPECPPGGAVTQPNPSPSPVRGPCDGPLASEGETGDGPFSVSADGRRVAFVTSARLRGVVEASAPATDVLVAELDPALPRKAAVREVTREGADGPSNLPIESVELSGDGRWLAFSTQRVRFALSEPTPIGTTFPTVGGGEVYAVDLQARTLELVTRGADGTQAVGNQVISLPSLDHDGARVAFASAATNLVPGDGNEQPDAFVSHRVPDLAAPSPVVLPLAAGVPDPPARWVLRARARRRSDGTVALEAVVPGPGTLEVRLRPTRSRLVRRPRTVLVRAPASGPGLVRLRLHPRGVPVRALRRRGTPATVTVRFTAAGRPALRERLALRLRREGRR